MRVSARSRASAMLLEGWSSVRRNQRCDCQMHLSLTSGILDDLSSCSTVLESARTLSVPVCWISLVPLSVFAVCVLCVVGCALNTNN